MLLLDESRFPNLAKGKHMNELIQQLIQKTGLPEDKAIAAVDTVMGLLKEKLPGPVASHLDAALSGATGATEKLGGMVQDLGGMFGKK